MADAAARSHATIEDVAAAAGVSRAAVSKVLRNAYGVSDAMRERVTAAMVQLEYRPRVAARAMRGRSYTIGIEIPDFGNQFFATVLKGAMGVLADSNFQLIVAPAEPGSRHGLRAIEALVDRQVDGVIAASPPVEASSLDRIAHHTPVVMFGRDDASDHYDTVAGDDVLGTSAAMAHLLSIGHRQIAHLTLHEADESNAQPHGVRLRQYRAAMAAAGLAANEVVLRSDEGQDTAYAAVLDAIEQGWEGTAIFAGHDELAIGVLRAVAETGTDLSVVGYDGVAIAAHPALGLTTVHQPGEAMGARAVELLLERMAGRTEAIHEVFEPELRIRTSTRPLS